jgi:hypothetical protein
MNAEAQRLEQTSDTQFPWRKWGPCLSERQWGTVREDCSENGKAWDYFSRGQSQARACHRGEDRSGRNVFEGESRGECPHVIEGRRSLLRARPELRTRP